MLRLSIFSRVGVIALIAVASFFASDGCRMFAHETETKDWITLDNCRLIPNKANDGDSFHVRGE